MKAYSEVGRRIRERLLELDYRKDNGEPDVMRFCWDHRFDKTNVYNWLGDVVTPFRDLERLCTALDCSSDWLLFGKEPSPKAKPGRARQGSKKKNLLLVLALGALGALPSGRGVVHAAPQSAVSVVDSIRLIGRRCTFRNDYRCLNAGMVYA